MQRQNDSPLKTKEEAAHYLRCSIRKFYGLVAAGEIAPTVIGDRRLYSIQELNRYIAAQTRAKPALDSAAVVATA